MVLGFWYKRIREGEKFLQEQGVRDALGVLERLEPANYEENFGAKLVRLWDCLPGNKDSIMHMMIALFHKFL
jgi:hypothetical protein